MGKFYAWGGGGGGEEEKIDMKSTLPIEVNKNPLWE